MCADRLIVKEAWSEVTAVNDRHVLSAGVSTRIARRGCCMVWMWVGHDSRALTARVQHIAPRTGALALILLSLVGLSRCDVSQPLDMPASVFSSAPFMDAWKTSLHYEPSKEPDEIRPDLQPPIRGTGTHAAFMQNHSSVHPLPAAMRSVIAPFPFGSRPLSSLPFRGTLDPYVMAAVCVLPAAMWLWLRGIASA